MVFSRQGPMYRADCSVHVGSGITLQSHGEAGEIYSSFDVAADRVEKRLRRYKRRLRGHPRSNPEEAIAAQSYVIAPDTEVAEGVDDEGWQEGEENHPVIIAETATKIDSLTVGEAVMRMDLADLPALMFRNRAHGGLNVVYRRPDGNIGWIDPTNVPDST